MSISIQLSREELISLCSALNEVLECVEDWEFEIKLGRTKEEIQLLLKSLSAKIPQSS